MATPGRSIFRTPRATRSRCSAIRRGTCRSHAASRSISTKAGTRSTALPRPIVVSSPGSSPWKNGVPISARRSPRNSMRDYAPIRRKVMSAIKGFHAHVYYDAETKPKAAQLRETIIGKFKIEPGAFSDEPRGPHPISQFNVIFENSEFQNIVPWLMLNRDGLDVLVHPLTESSYDDHSKNALWLGTPGPLRLQILRPQYRESLLPTSQRA